MSAEINLVYVRETYAKFFGIPIERVSAKLTDDGKIDVWVEPEGYAPTVCADIDVPVPGAPK